MLMKAMESLTLGDGGSQNDGDSHNNGNSHNNG